MFAVLVSSDAGILLAIGNQTLASDRLTRSAEITGEK